MKKYIIAGFLLVCMLSVFVSPVLAAQDTDRIITPKAMASEQLQEHISSKIAEQAKSHNPAIYTNVVPGVGGLKYEGEQVPKGFEYIPETVTMVSWHNEGRLHIRDTNHKTVTIQVPWSTLQEVEGFDGEHVRIWHYNDAGVCDGKWVQTVRNEGGFAYLESVPFSEIIVGGYTGTYSKVETEIDITDTITLGRTFDSDDVSSLTLEIDDQYASKTDPYDIDTTGLVAWYRFDDAGSTVIDYSGNGNNGTFVAATYTEGKYNSGGYFDGIDDVVNCGNDETLNLTDELTIICYINQSDVVYNQNFGILRKGTTQDNILRDAESKNYRFALYDTNNDYKYVNSIVSPTATENKLVQLAATKDSSGKMTLYINGDYDNHAQYSPFVNRYSTSDLEIGNVYGNEHFYGTIDELLIYNHSLTSDEIKEQYWIGPAGIQAKTNSHAEYSDYWNSSADNPLSVPFGASESISSLTFVQPESIVQNGVTVYDPVNMLFNTSVEVGWTEDTTLIKEEVNGDSYQIFIQHIPGLNSTTGTVSFTSDPNAILSSPYLTTGMDTNNTNASMSYNDAIREWTVTTGPLVAGQEYNYVLYGVLEGSVLEEVVEGGFGSDNMHAYTATGNDTVIVGSAFRAAYGDSVWGNQSNDLWEDAGAMIALAALMLVVGIVLVSIRRYRA